MIMTSFLNQLAGLIIDGKRNKGEPHKRKAWYVDAVSSGDKPGREKLGASYAMSTPPPQQRLI